MAHPALCKHVLRHRVSLVNCITPRFGILALKGSKDAPVQLIPVEPATELQFRLQLNSSPKASDQQSPAHCAQLDLPSAVCYTLTMALIHKLPSG